MATDHTENTTKPEQTDNEKVRIETPDAKSGNYGRSIKHFPAHGSHIGKFNNMKEEQKKLEPENTDVLFCMDCGLPYEIFGMDAVMPRAQWLEINPDDGGLLCANCMVKRASNVKGATCIHFIIEVFSK